MPQGVQVRLLSSARLPYDATVAFQTLTLVIEVRILMGRVRQFPGQIPPVVKDKGYFSQRVQGGEPCRGEILGGTGA